LPAEIEGVVFAMKMASLAKLEANARNVARMLGVLANKERVRCAVSQKTEGAGGPTESCPY